MNDNDIMISSDKVIESRSEAETLLKYKLTRKVKDVAEPLSRGLCQGGLREKNCCTASYNI